MDLVLYGLYSLIVLIVLIIFKQGMSRTVEFLSMRNLYLFSFCIYQLASPALALGSGNYWFYRLNFPENTGKTFLMLAATFLLVFFISYHKLKPTQWLAGKFSGAPGKVDDYLLICLAGVLVAAAIPLRFMPLPVIAKPSVQIAIAFLGIACAIAGWVWSQHRSSISTNVIVGTIVAISFALAVSSTFGRRPLIGVALGFIWGAYYRRTWTMTPMQMLRFLLPLAVAAAVAVSAFTAIRGTVRGKSTGDTLGHIAKANIKAGALDILGGQACGSTTLWAIEQWPDRFEPRKFYSLRFMAYWYVPRFMWPEKPAPLGNDIATLADIRGVNRHTITIPPGVIGYGWAEGGWLTVIVYALFFGQFLRFFDELVRRNPTSVYIILPVGCCLGQVVGLARGCIAIFTNLTILGFLSTFLILYVVNKLFGERVRTMQMVAWPQYR